MKLQAALYALGTVFTAAAIPPAYHYAHGNLSPRSAPENLTPDAILVFTGAKDRVSEAHKMFNAGLSGMLMISGYDDFALPDMPGRIFMDATAQNTIENARNSALWAKEYDLKSILLITSDYHIDRSYFELRRLLPKDTEIFVKAIPGTGRSNAVDSEKNRLLCRMYETFLERPFCYQLRTALRGFNLA